MRTVGLAIVMLAGIAVAQEPDVPWDVSLGDTKEPGKPLEFRRGATYTITPRFLQSGAALSLSNATGVELRYRSLDMTAGLYYSLTGAVHNATNGQVRIRWGAGACAAATNYAYDVVVFGSSSTSVMLSAWGTIRLISSVYDAGTIATNPAARTSIDCARTDWANLSYAPFLPRGGGGADLSTTNFIIVGDAAGSNYVQSVALATSNAIVASTGSIAGASVSGAVGSADYATTAGSADDADTLDGVDVAALFLLDQTVPQTVSGGAPQFASGATFGNSPTVRASDLGLKLGTGLGKVGENLLLHMQVNGGILTTYGDLNLAESTTLNVATIGTLRVNGALTALGAMGIGTNNPSYRLHVYDPSLGEIACESGTRKLIQSSYASDNNYMQSYGAPFYLGCYDAQYLSFRIDNAERARLAAGGFYIGNAGLTSGYQFDVAGSALVRTNLSIGSAAQTNTILTLTTGAGGSNVVNFIEDSVTYFRILHDASPSSPNNRLRIQSSSGAGGIDTTAVTITQGGTVGVRTTSPTAGYEVDFNGSAFIRTNLTVSGVITQTLAESTNSFAGRVAINKTTAPNYPLEVSGSIGADNVIAANQYMSAGMIRTIYPRVAGESVVVTQAASFVVYGSAEVTTNLTVKQRLILPGLPTSTNGFAVSGTIWNSNGYLCVWSAL